MKNSVIAKYTAWHVPAFLYFTDQEAGTERRLLVTTCKYATKMVPESPRLARESCALHRYAIK